MYNRKCVESLQWEMENSTKSSKYTTGIGYNIFHQPL